MTTFDRMPRPGTVPFSVEEAFARALDQADPLRGLRGEFELPRHDGGQPLAYFLGNSLGPMPKAARRELAEALDAWTRFGVEGFTSGRAPWATYQESFRDGLARLAGAEPGEVVTMNTLTVNLHLMLASFYRPAGSRVKVLMEAKAFPSDRYAVVSHLRLRGVDPDDAILLAEPREGEAALRTEDVEALIGEHGSEIALVMLGGVNYFTGQYFDLGRISEASRRAGCLVGFDLAHAIGNVPLALHDWEADFAVWCSYKYLNGGPGATAGAFVHARHGRDPAAMRLAGWWGNDPASRFSMRPGFDADEGAAGWQVSTPSILSMAPLRASLGLFDRVGLPALREKSASLTGYLEALLAGIPDSPLRILTPTDRDARGCQLSIQFPGHGRALHQSLRDEGLVTDYREPDVIRIAPAPFFNTYHEVWRAGLAIRQAVRRIP